MTVVFWLVAALFIAGVLLMLLPPLLAPGRVAGGASASGANLAVYRDQWREAERERAAGLVAPERADEMRRELERRLIDDTAAADRPAGAAPARRTALLLAVLLPLASLAGYRVLGDPRALTAAVPTAARPSADGHQVTQAQIEQMATSLGERLRATPGDAQGWAMLARSYTALGRYRDAVLAFRRADELQPGQPALLADYADVLAMVQGKRLAGEPAKLVQRALDADPRHAKALALAGSASFEAREYAAARGYWERLLAVIDPASPMARSVQGSIAQARQLEQPAATAAAAASGERAVSGRIEVAAALAARVAPGDTLFVVARAVDGPRMPVAIIRRPVQAWPSDFTLDDSLAMSTETRLSGFGRLLVSARISRSGNAMPVSGDLLAEAVPAAPGDQGLRLVIDKVQP